MNCPACGVANGPDDRFCAECGTPLTEAADATGDVAAISDSLILARLDEEGRPYTLGDNAVIGRLDNCDLPINHQSISRQHARVRQRGHGFVIEDLGSTNGTLVNGVRITDPIPLDPGDIVSVGAIDFRVEPGRARSAVEIGNAAVSSNGRAEDENVLLEVAERDAVEAPPSPRSVATTLSMPAQPETSGFTAPGEPGTSGEVTVQALETMRHLSDLLQELARRTAEQEVDRARLRDMARTLEEANRRQESFRQEVQGALAQATALQRVEEAHGLLEALVRSPRDIELLMRVSREADALRAIMADHLQLRRVIEKFPST